MKLDIEFFPNTEDNTHCLQAALKSVLRSIYPDRNFTYKELDKLCKKQKNKFSSTTAFLVSLKKMGLDVKLISLFNYKKFSKDGLLYLISHYPKEIVESWKKTCDIDSEIKYAKIILKYGIIEKRKITIREIENFFSEKWFIIANVNYFTLHNKKGYSGHAVLITGIGKNSIWLHDPGSPPLPNRKVGKKLFMEALSYTKDNEVFLIRP